MTEFNRNQNGMFLKDSSVYSVMYGPDSVLLEDELNETQWNIIERVAATMKQKFTNGISSDYIINTTAYDNVFYVESSNAISFLVDGYELKVSHNSPPSIQAGLSANNRIVFKLNPATTSVRTDLIFIEAWFEVIDGLSTIRKYGGDTTPILVNNIIDNRVSSETSRRLQFKWRLRVVDGNTDLLTINSLDASGASTGINYSLYENIYMSNIGPKRKPNSDLLSTGIIYGIPLFNVTRPANNSAISIGNITDIIPKSNLIVNGDLTLKNNPTQSMHAATKQYVDSITSGIGGNYIAGYVSDSAPSNVPKNTIWIDTN